MTLKEIKKYLNTLPDNCRVVLIVDEGEAGAGAAGDNLHNIKTREERRGLKILFLNKYLSLFKQAFPKSSKKIAHSDWKQPLGRRLVELARKQIGFSEKTANMDIFWNLYIFYKNNYIKTKKK